MTPPLPPLTRILREKIAAEGPISVADFMGLALGHPDHGYYRRQDPIGARGDFITAPEISQIFGEMIGVWCANMWQMLGSPPISLVELGPGRGTLMSDLLRATRAIPNFHASLTVHMIETSPVLAHAQYTALRAMHPRIEWLDDIAQLPDSPTIFIANEFFDALPIKQFQMTVAGVAERRIDWDEASQRFTFTLAPAGLQLAKSGSIIPVGTIMEQSPASRAVMRQICTRIATHGGAALLIDYGYFGEAHHDTLQAVKNHAFHPVLADPGDADLTAHVDFASLLALAREQKLGAFGTVTQGEFLLNMGAQLRRDRLLKAARPDQQEAIAQGLERLVSPQAMGELFKVIAVTPTPSMVPPAFG